MTVMFYHTDDLPFFQRQRHVSRPATNICLSNSLEREFFDKGSENVDYKLTYNPLKKTVILTSYGTGIAPSLYLLGDDASSRRRSWEPVRENADEFCQLLMYDLRDHCGSNKHFEFRVVDMNYPDKVLYISRDDKGGIYDAAFDKNFYKWFEKELDEDDD